MKLAQDLLRSKGEGTTVYCNKARLPLREGAPERRPCVDPLTSSFARHNSFCSFPQLQLPKKLYSPPLVVAIPEDLVPSTLPYPFERVRQLNGPAKGVLPQEHTRPSSSQFSLARALLSSPSQPAALVGSPPPPFQVQELTPLPPIQIASQAPSFQGLPLPLRLPSPSPAASPTMETPTFSATVSPLHHPSSTADPASTSASTSSSAPSSSGAPLLVSSRKRSASMYEEQDDPRLAPTLSGHREGSTLAEEGESAGPSTVEQPASEPRSGLLRRGELARKAVERRKGTGSVVSTRGVGGPSGMARSRSEGGLTALLGEGGDGPTLKRRKEDHEGTGTFIQVDSFLSPTTPPLDLPLAPLDPTFAPPPFPTIDSLAPPTAFLSSLPFPSPTPSLAPTPLSPPLPSRAGPHRRERSFSLPTPLKRSHSVPYLSSRPASPFQPSHGRKHKFYETPRRQRAAETESPSAKLLPSQLLALHTVYSFPRVGVPGRGVLLEATPLGPPITRTTLKELDLHEILRNPQLRHDVVFDPNLMFRPNHDGERFVLSSSFRAILN